MSRRARFRERLEAAGLVHVDARVLAFHLLGDGRYVGLTRLLFDGLDAGEVEAQTSAVSLYQLLAEPYRRRRADDASSVADYLTALRGLELVPAGAGVARRAAQVRARLGGRPERALQIATALEGGADVFLAQGSGIRRVAGTEVLDLDDYTEADE